MERVGKLLSLTQNKINNKNNDNYNAFQIKYPPFLMAVLLIDALLGIQSNTYIKFRSTVSRKNKSRREGIMY